MTIFEITRIAQTEEEENAMDEKQFSERAFSWRGRAVIERNLTIIEGTKSK